MTLKLPIRCRDHDDNLIPLINIVFLLLVFFMLAGAFSHPELFEVTPPVSASPVPAEEGGMVVLLGADGRLAVGEREVDKAELRRLITGRLSSGSDLQVQLKTDGHLVAEKLIEVMDVFRDAGVERLHLLTTMVDD